jgi:hypothetical protein
MPIVSQVYQVNYYTKENILSMRPPQESMMKLTNLSPELTQEFDKMKEVVKLSSNPTQV